MFKVSWLTLKNSVCSMPVTAHDFNILYRNLGRIPLVLSTDTERTLGFQLLVGVESVFHCSSRRKHDNLWIKVMLQITICFSFFSSPLCPHFLLLLLKWWAVMIKFDVEKAWVTLPPCGLFLSLMTPCRCKCHMPTRSLLPNSREMAWVTFDVDM